MAKTKGDIVRKALRKIGVASSATLSQIEPESMADALEDLEDMMAEWDVEGIKIGFAFGSEPLSPDDSCGLPDWAINGAALGLAMQISPDYNRPITAELAAEAFSAKMAVRKGIVFVPSLARRNDMPVGQGNKPFRTRNRFYVEPHTLQDEDGNQIIEVNHGN